MEDRQGPATGGHAAGITTFVSVQGSSGSSYHESMVLMLVVEIAIRAVVKSSRPADNDMTCVEFHAFQTRIVHVTQTATADDVI